MSGLVLAASTLLTTPVWSGQTDDQQMLKEEIRSALSTDPVFSQQQIGVSTFGRRVVLHGTLPDQKTVDRAVEIVKHVEGVQSIQNSLIIDAEGSHKAPVFRDFQSP